MNLPCNHGVGRLRSGFAVEGVADLRDIRAGGSLGRAAADERLFALSVLLEPVGLGFLLLHLEQTLPVGDRDLVVVGMDLAEGEKAVPVAAVFDEGGLQRRFDPDNLGEVDVALELLFRRRFDVVIFETITVQYHHAGFFRVALIDQHALRHRGVNSGRPRPGPARPGSWRRTARPSTARDKGWKGSTAPIRATRAIRVSGWKHGSVGGKRSLSSWSWPHRPRRACGVTGVVEQPRPRRSERSTVNCRIRGRRTSPRHDRCRSARVRRRASTPRAGH